MRPHDSVVRRHCLHPWRFGLLPQRFVRCPRSIRPALVLGLFHQIGFHRLDADHCRIDSGDAAQDPLVGQVILVDPKTRETGVPVKDRQPVIVRFLADELEQFFRLFVGDHEQTAVLDHPLVDRPHAVPTPGFDALAHRIVEHDGDVGVVDLELGAAFRFQLLLLEIGGNKSEILAGNPVSLRRVAVTTVGEWPSGPSGWRS